MSIKKHSLYPTHTLQSCLSETAEHATNTSSVRFKRQEQHPMRLCRNALEAQWMTFFASLGTEFQYKSGHTSTGLELPDFYLPRNQTWVEIRSLQEGEECFGEALKMYADFVEDTHQSVIVFFGAPKIRIPRPQGWALRWINDKLSITPIHMISSHRNKGFSIACIGSASRKIRHSGVDKSLLAWHTPSPLEKAYHDAEHRTLWDN